VQTFAKGMAALGISLEGAGGASTDHHPGRTFQGDRGVGQGFQQGRAFGTGGGGLAAGDHGVRMAFADGLGQAFRRCGGRGG